MTTDSFAAVYAHVQQAYPKLIWPQQWFSPNRSGATVSMLSGTKDMLETLFLAVQRDVQPDFKPNPFIHPCDVLFLNTVDGTLDYRKSEMLSRYARQNATHLARLRTGPFGQVPGIAEYAVVNALLLGWKMPNDFAALRVSKPDSDSFVQHCKSEAQRIHSTDAFWYRNGNAYSNQK